MLRQISKAARINREGKRNAMNNKSEWNYINVPHIAAERRFRLFLVSLHHLTVLLRILSAHHNIASTDEDRKVEQFFITVQLTFKCIERAWDILYISLLSCIARTLFMLPQQIYLHGVLKKLPCFKDENKDCQE